ncbi:MAG: hypothetical protein NXI24_14755 [bacterium]|nr:hypothetical protein [bacterium]
MTLVEKFLSSRSSRTILSRGNSLIRIAILMAIAFGAISPQLHARAEAGLFCGYRFALPGDQGDETRWRLIQNEPELMIYESSSKIDATGGARMEAQWLFSCNSNPARTSQVSEIRDAAEARGQVIHQLEEVALDREVLAAVFTRTRVFEGNRVKSVEAYFATRDLEYRIFALPARGGSGQIPSAAYLKLDQLLRETLDRLRFAGEIQPTITEADYRARLYMAGGAGAVLVILLFAFALRILLGKAKQATTGNENGRS